MSYLPLTLAPGYFIIDAQNKEHEMANHPSALRQWRRSLRRNEIIGRNKAALRTQVKRLRDAVQQKDKETAEKILPQTVSLIDKSIKKGVIHENKGARYKSRLSRQVALINPAPPK
jgi:small subunit ribosomal protein S20